MECWKIRGRSFLPLVLSAVAALPLLPGVAAGADQALNARWQHQSSQDADTIDEYTLSYTLELSQDITEVMTFQESFRYSRQWEEDDETEMIDPSLRFTVNNDLFVFGLLGAASEQRSDIAVDRSRRNWEATWNSNWDRRFWPKVRASYGRDYSYDGENPRKQDFEGERASAGLDWDLELFKVYYNVNRSHNNDNVTQGEDTLTSHLARLETSGTFFDNRLNFTFSQQYSLSQTDSSTAVGPGGFALIREPVSEALSGRDNTPLVNTAGELTSKGQLIDGDLGTAVADVFTNGLDIPPLNLAFRMNLREVDLLYLYTEMDASAVSGAFSLNLYSSSNGLDYQLVRVATPFTYNSLERRFEIPVASLRQQWLKLVITASPIQRVDFTEIQAFDQVFSSGAFVARSDKTVNNLTDLSLGYRFSPTLDLTYNLGLEYGKYSAETDYTRSNQLGQVRWVPGEYLTASLGVNENREDVQGQPETLNRSYSLRLSSPPVPTVDLNFGLSHSERYEDGTLKTTSQDTGLYASAALYPDLDANLDMTYGQTQQEESGEKTSHHGSRLALTARLVPRLTADFNTDYRKTSGTSETETMDSTLTLNWRVSDLLSLLAVGTKQWEDWRSSGESILLQASVAPTETTQFSLNYLHSTGTESTDRLGATGNWTIGPHLLLQANASYIVQGEEKDWQLGTQLTARFATR